MAITVSDGGQEHGHSQVGEVYHPPACAGVQTHGHSQAGTVALTTSSVATSAIHYGDTIDASGLHYNQVDEPTGIHYNQVEVTVEVGQE